ncbi:DUF5316 domain-containing protein [Metabacillus arenae]|uniref:DUF5316 domain-containing protein n=1 Tax=Metabacillus arenae TaxID=2771434 RepID=A0A926NS34_9BACI|nr:DUF5316 domain-containing protein [Metabacillus arenae]MBD1382851.1 DUF5316 domain-containing protein [Metabacillus arenae]
MEKSFLAGSFLLVVGVLFSVMLNDWTLIYKISGSAGLTALLISGLLIGAFINGDPFRANEHSEDQEDRRRRTNYAFLYAAFSVPNLVGSVVFYLFS